MFQAVNSTTGLALATNMRNVVRGTLAMVEEATNMLFDHNIDPRTKRQFFEAGLMAVQAINFGLTLKNMADIASFRKQMETTESQMKALIALNDEIVRTQLRDHAEIMELINTTMT